MPSLSVPFDRLTRLARIMEITTIVGMVLITALIAIAFVSTDWMRSLVLAKFSQAGAQLPITPLTRWAAGAVIAVPVGVMLYGLFAVRSLFKEFAHGQVFTVNAARYLQTFGATILAQALLGPLTGAALSVVLTLGNPPGQRSLMIALSSQDYLALIVGGALLAVATVMREAARLADENASFV